MDVTDFLTNVNDTWHGTDEIAPGVGTDDANYWIRVASRVRRDLYKDLTKQWRSTIQTLNLGPMSASTSLVINLPANYLGAANDCYVIDNNGTRHDFDIVEPQDADYMKQQVYVSGMGPATLTFTKPVLSTDAFSNGTLYLPAYTLPADIDGSNGSNMIYVDDIDWLILATSAELAFNDVTYESKAPDLNAKATAAYKQMLNNNRRGTAGAPRKGRYDVTRIGQRHGARLA